VSIQHTQHHLAQTPFGSEPSDFGGLNDVLHFRPLGQPPLGVHSGKHIIPEQNPGDPPQLESLVHDREQNPPWWQKPLLAVGQVESLPELHSEKRVLCGGAHVPLAVHMPPPSQLLPD
jgi:hypothetical protein